MLNQKTILNGLGLTTRLMHRDYELEAQYAEVTEDLLALAKVDKNARDTRSGKTFGGWDTALECDMRDGCFPLLHGKKVAIKSVIGELAAFLRGYDNAADFREMGTKIWDANANVSPGWLNNPARKGEDDLGRIYGVQWTDWQRQDGVGINQIHELITGLIRNPFERGHIVSAWNVGELHLMALKPCHVMFQCYVDNGYRLHLKMFQRSADWFLGVPFNLASYGFLLLWLCQRTGYEPGKLKIEFGDFHLYANHVDQAKKYLAQREEMETNAMRRSDGQFLVMVAGNKVGEPVPPTMRGCFSVNTSHFDVAGYEPEPAIDAPMAP